MLLHVLGLTNEESRVYRELIKLPSCAPADLSAGLGMETAQVAYVLGRLANLGLAARSGEDTGRFVASPPAVALGALLARRQNEIRLAELELNALEETYRAAASQRTIADVIDVVQGAEAIRQRFEQLQIGAREEVMAFVTAPSVVVESDENTAEDAALARGVSYRVVLERAMLEDDVNFFGEVEKVTALGTRVRVIDSLPMKLLIVDRELALVPIAAEHNVAASGALMVHRSALLDALIALFECMWNLSSEIVTMADGIAEVGPGQLDDIDAKILSLLLAGLTDQAVAGRLGTSLRTVQRRVRHLMDLTGAQTRTQLGRQAARLGWV
ncbi:Sugar-specific transcriptional regulator TrmB [Micromonospora viridifaciens]|uniref:Sugar-specific transcriptional regulator TrmB n=1 Tax=Micromonospora viridifaciens TaxID=1881 RepID=A0A1C4WT33_MICVI|nr:Sugar-specific transcriptional regulator TrmB [Micromonospora viridifaciens]